MILFTKTCEQINIKIAINILEAIQLLGLFGQKSLTKA